MCKAVENVTSYLLRKKALYVPKYRHNYDKFYLKHFHNSQEKMK